LWTEQGKLELPDPYTLTEVPIRGRKKLQVTDTIQRAVRGAPQKTKVRAVIGGSQWKTKANMGYVITGSSKGGSSTVLGGRGIVSKVPRRGKSVERTKKWSWRGEPSKQKGVSELQKGQAT